MEIHTVGQGGESRSASIDQRYPPEPHPGTDREAALECAAIARSMLRARADRRRFFEASLFSEPAWDILLELFVAYAMQRRIQVSAVGAAALIPPTTTLRWLNLFLTKGLIERKNDPSDARRIFVSMSEKGALAMMQHIRSLHHNRLI